MELLEQIAASEFVSVIFDGVIVHDGEFVTAANTRAAEMFGYESAETLIGLAYQMLMSPAAKDQTEKCVSSRYEGQYSALCKRRGGEDFVADANAREMTIDGRRARIVALRYAVDSATESLIQRSLMLDQAVASLSTVIEHRDSSTSGHQNRVSTLGEQIARRLGMSEREIATIRLGGKIHDVGKVSMPAEILMKPGALDDLEYSFIKMHSERGVRIPMISATESGFIRAAIPD